MPTLSLRLRVRFVLPALVLLASAAGPAWAQEQPVRPAPRRPAPNGTPPPARPAPAQPPPPTPYSELGLALDARYLQLRDDLAVPRVYGGLAPGLDLTYDFRGSEHRHDARLGFAAGSPSDSGAFHADVYSFVADYGFGYRVYAHDNPGLHVFAGARVGGASDVAYYPRVDETHAYWFTRYDLRPQVMAELAVDPRSRASLSVDFPLFGLVSRPPDMRLYSHDKDGAGYLAGKVHEDLQFRTVNTYLGVDIGLKYRYQVSRSIAESIEYRFAYASADEPRSIQVLTHSLRLGIHLDPWKW